MNRRVLFTIGASSLIVVTAYATVRVESARSRREQFHAAFGAYPEDRAAAQLAVSYQLRALAYQACEAAKQFQVFPTDNYPLEVSCNSNFRRLEHNEALARLYGFEAPDLIEKFRHHPKWTPGARYQDLCCFDEHE